MTVTATTTVVVATGDESGGTAVPVVPINTAGSAESNEIRIESSVVTAASELAESSKARPSASQQKLKVDEMLEAYLNKYSSSTTTTTTTTNASPAPIKLKLVQQPQAVPNENENKKPSSDLQTIPKLKITNLYAAAVTAAAATEAKSADFAIEEFSIVTESSRLVSNDNFDDNAVDSDELMKSTKSDEHLIWKPITTKISVSMHFSYCLRPSGIIEHKYSKFRRIFF